jgi:exodeoxyribonuclease V alpha subunit
VVPEASPTARALLALELLQANPGITADRLATRLGVSDRAARRYVAVLREAGVPVESVRGPYGGYRIGRGLRLTPLVFTSTEALALVDPATGQRYAGPEENARLRAGDVLLVDEAGMLDQDTARALLVVADEHDVRVALLGDRRQLAAVGRGGVLDLAAGRVDPAAHVTLDEVHRFTGADQSGQTVLDSEYADLTLAMRDGADPGAVFDALAARGQIRLQPDQAALSEALAALAAEHRRRGEQTAIVVDTGEQAAELGAAIRERLVADRRVDDLRVAVTGAGQRIGAGDRIATRRNDRALGVANRDIWTVTAVDRHGALAVVPDDVTPTRTVPPGVTPGVTPAGAGELVLPAGYVTTHVELAYASTAHGVQGDTVTSAHVVIGEHTGAASAYVGMTRGRTANIAHLVAADPAEARQKWMAVFGRDRADLGPGHAAQLAAAEAARYAQSRPLDQVLTELHEAWTVEQRCLDRLAVLQPQRDTLRAFGSLQAAQHADEVGALGCTPGPAERLSYVDRSIAAAEHELADARERISRLVAHPALLGQPADRLAAAHEDWRARRAADPHQPRTAPPRPVAAHPSVPRPESERRGPSLTWGGAAPSLGR